MVAEGRISFSPAVAEEMDLCLGCRACETACPSGVNFGSLLEKTRDEARRVGLPAGIAKRTEAMVLNHLIPYPRRLRFFVNLLRVMQVLRIDRIVRALLPHGLRRMLEFLPTIASSSERASLPRLIPAKGERRGRVAFFVGCIAPEFFSATQRATVEVLAQNGFEVMVPQGQGCCGALHAHSGELDHARELIRKNQDVFKVANVEAVIVDSAGCGAGIRDCENWIGEEGRWLAMATRDIFEFLHEKGVRPPERRVEVRVSYDDPCHLAHGQRVVDAPREVLKMIPGLELVEIEDAQSCCGAAGIYNLTHEAMSEAVLERKLENIQKAGAEFVASGNPGCLLQLNYGFRTRGMHARALHPIEILAAAYDASFEIAPY